MLICTFCTYTLQWPVFTNNRFLSPSSSCLSLLLTLCCVLVVCLNDHTLSLLVSHLCLCLCFAHFNSCVCGVAPLVVSAFPFVHVHCALCPALYHCVLHCVSCLCVFGCPCLCISVFLRFIASLLNFIVMHFISVLFSLCFTLSLCLHSLTSAFLGVTEL